MDTVQSSLTANPVLLTTFNTPYGKYCFICLPFGLSCSKDVFQKRMDQILEEYEGCIGIADDITIHVCTEAEHDAHLWKLMEVAWKYHLVFNPKKTQVKAPMVKFFGCLYDESVVHPDPEKVDAVHALPTPTNITEVQEFLGMVTYLSPFISGLSTLTAPLCELLKKDAEFSWEASYQTAFQCVKDADVSDPTLQYFDSSCPITVQVDATQVGHGAALLQDNKLVTFANKALTEVEHHYANIECEILAVVTEAEWFRNYVYSRPFTIESEHKPLESITKKSLAHTPAQLQHMLLCMKEYDYILCYHPGKEMTLPDTLSHFKPKPGPEIVLEIAIHHAFMSPFQKEALKLAFEMDVEMCALPDIIFSGWSNNIKEVPQLLHPYWQHCESLTVEDGLVFCGEALIIPTFEREKFLGTLHQSHQSITINTVACPWLCFLAWYQKAIVDAVWQCETCMRFQAQNAATPLTPTPAHSNP